MWAEAWFNRQDLPPGYDGWQAINPTPMECSEGNIVKVEVSLRFFSLTENGVAYERNDSLQSSISWTKL